MNALVQSMEELRNKKWGDGVYDLLSWFDTERVRNARVLVVGAGALGNEVLKNLALFGVGNIYVVDYDTIEYSNLTRSILFREEDADKGLYKVDIAAKRIKEINHNINIHPIVGRLDSGVGLGLYKTMDVVIGCLDGQLARVQLNRQCMRIGKTWVDGSIENLKGVVRIFSPGESCYECELPQSTKNIIYSRTSCADVAQRSISQGRIPTTPVIASIIGGVQTQEAMKILHKVHNNHSEFTPLGNRWFVYEGSHLSTNIYEAQLWSDNCPAHENWSDIVTVEHLGANMTVRQALQCLTDHLHCSQVEINLRNTRFVDKLVSKHDNRSYNVMCPEYKVSNFIEKIPELNCLMPGEINQRAYENIDEDFPYQDLTLNDIGIPYWDIIQVCTNTGRFYVEMGADKKHYDL